MLGKVALKDNNNYIYNSRRKHFVGIQNAYFLCLLHFKKNKKLSKNIL